MCVLVGSIMLVLVLRMFARFRGASSLTAPWTTSASFLLAPGLGFACSLLAPGMMAAFSLRYYRSRFVSVICTPGPWSAPFSPALWRRLILFLTPGSRTSTSCAVFLAWFKCQQPLRQPIGVLVSFFKRRQRLSFSTPWTMGISVNYPWLWLLPPTTCLTSKARSGWGFFISLFDYW